MSFGSWLELITSGLITGGIYALVALGLNLQYGLMRVLNIAHGEFLMLGAFLTWAALEILTHAVAKAGLDRKAIRDYVAATEHNTILGKIKFVGSENVGTPGTVSQWQKGEFEVVWPKAQATAPLIAAKPAWV